MSSLSIRSNFDVLLVDRVNAGFSPSPRRPREPNEHPTDTARRECHEELEIEVSLAGDGANPAFLTITGPLAWILVTPTQPVVHC